MIAELAIVDEIERRKAQRRLHELFPDADGEYRGEVMHARAGYPRHLEFFEAGAQYRERCFMAANRVGKSVAGAYEVALHLTGLYPDWWQGRRFKTPVRAWAAGKTNETTRDIVQAVLLGEITGSGATKGVSGTGMVPGRLLGRTTWKQGVPDLVDTVQVKHASGRWSTLGLKSYQQGRGSFEGTAQHVIWLDEEPPADVYGECLIRTATTRGLIMLTFTPLEGMSEVVLQFLSGHNPGANERAA
jgi:phage terminase large subunit-like protein